MRVDLSTEVSMNRNREEGTGMGRAGGGWEHNMQSPLCLVRSMKPMSAVCIVDLHPEALFVFFLQVCGVYGAGAAAACVPGRPRHVVEQPRGLLPRGAQSHGLPAAEEVLEGPQKRGGVMGGEEGGGRWGLVEAIIQRSGIGGG